jgi:hypothetical protein
MYPMLVPTPLRKGSNQVLRGVWRIGLLGVAVVVGAMGAWAQAPVQAQGDPPAEVARISLMQGNVSVEPASVDQFSAAQVNDVLTSGDRVYADAGANAELETGELAVRMGQQTDLTITAMTDQLEQFGLAQGSVHLRSFALPLGTTVELDTPNAAVTVLQPGDVRVDVDPDGGTTTVEVVSGQAQVDGNGFQQVMEQGQRVELEGSNPVSAQELDAATADGLDGFSGARDAAYENASQGEDAYVNPDTIGAEDLSANGDWETDADDGAVWYPTAVAVGWAPYSVGHWAWVAPWGWTWVDSYAWGFAPFHYGRWVHKGSRWGWVPGSTAVRPVYAPAMVAFVGGAGLTAWFPLGPHETYVPWYHASPLYENRVNVSNQYDRNANEVRAIYNQQTLAGAYAAGGERGYVNRSVATVAVTQASFAAGRPVSRVNAEALAGAPVTPHPLVTPERTTVVAAAAKAVPARVARPVLAEKPALEERTSEAEESEEQPQVPVGGTLQGVVSSGPGQRTVNAPATLFHKAAPPEPRPSFDQQQKAIETSDPGRPLGPQQMENLRQNRPAGPPEQREAPHSVARAAPAARPAPAARASGSKH